MSPPERSLYLFFLDRELGEAVGYQLDSSAARQVTGILLFATGARLLCGISLLYENTNLDRATFGFFSRLIAAGALDVISHQLSHEEFIASRIALYQHDAGRYPAYFGKQRPHVIQPTVYKSGGTTLRIVAGMTEWAFGIPELDPGLA